MAFFSRFFKFMSHDLAIDLGTANTVVYLRGRGVTGVVLVGLALEVLALRHGADGEPVQVSLSSEGVLTVANEGPVVPSEVLSRLMDRFERAGRHTDGSGLGLAIVHAVAQRIGGALVLKSPRTGQDAGFEASLTMPIVKGGKG